MTATTVSRETGLVGAYRDVLTDLDRRARNAARRNKPTMWAYFVEVREQLVDWFEARVEAWTDDEVASAAYQLHLIAAAACPNLLPGPAARLWAASVYARRILGAGGLAPRASLEWLRQRAA
jgi:hypothetical protein